MYSPPEIPNRSSISRSPVRPASQSRQAKTQRAEVADLCQLCLAATGTRHQRGIGWICYGCDCTLPIPDDDPASLEPDEAMLLPAFREAAAERREAERERE